MTTSTTSGPQSWQVTAPLFVSRRLFITISNTESEQVSQRSVSSKDESRENEPKRNQ